MRLVVGLGNPGEKYENNRHNVGFMVIDKLVDELRDKGYGLQQEWKSSTKGKLQYLWFEIKGERLELIKPQIFMNKSGNSVAYAYKNHPELKHNDIYVIHDDLDLTLGNYKIQKKGPREHNGLLSIYEELGTRPSRKASARQAKDFWHVRVGVDNREADNRIGGESFVLQNFKEDELEILGKTINNVVEELLERLSS